MTDNASRHRTRAEEEQAVAGLRVNCDQCRTARVADGTVVGRKRVARGAFQVRYAVPPR